MGTLGDGDMGTLGDSDMGTLGNDDTLGDSTWGS